MKTRDNSHIRRRSFTTIDSDSKSQVIEKLDENDFKKMRDDQYDDYDDDYDDYDDENYDIDDENDYDYSS